MLSLIHIELIKLKRAKIVWVIGVFLCLIPIFYGILLRNSQVSSGIPTLWGTFMWNNATTLGSLIGPLLFGLLRLIFSVGSLLKTPLNIYAPHQSH